LHRPLLPQPKEINNHPLHRLGEINNHRLEEINQILKAFFGVTFILYPSIGNKICRLFKCHAVGDLEFLEADMSIQCHTGAHIEYMLPIAWVCMFMFVFGIPLYTWNELHKNRKYLFDAPFSFLKIQTFLLRKNNLYVLVFVECMYRLLYKCSFLYVVCITIIATNATDRNVRE
jgi:hypothetical protein